MLPSSGLDLIIIFTLLGFNRDAVCGGTMQRNEPSYVGGRLCEHICAGWLPESGLETKTPSVTTRELCKRSVQSVMSKE